MAEPDYYELLGVPPSCSFEEIREAYRRAVRTAHPDVGGTAGMFRLITQAYETLSDPAARATYDAGRNSHEPVTDAEDGVDVDLGPEAGADWGTETTWDADAPRDVSGSQRKRMLKRLARSGVAHSSRKVSYVVALVTFVACLSVLVMPDLIRPAAAEPDVFGWLLQVPIITLAVAAFYLYLAFPIEISTLEAFVAPHGLGTLGFMAWPIAYGDIATTAEWLIYGAFVSAWLLYNAALFTIAVVNEADQQAERGLI